jgi:3-oxoacyl-[acyl-carrier-protein] synthase-3
MYSRNVRILGTGSYLPEKAVSSTELEVLLGLERGTIEHKTGMRNRYYAEFETATQMGTTAAVEALENAKIDKKDISCIVSCSGGPEQLIPCNAVLIQEKLELQDSGIPCFDINSTCLSFITGLDQLANAVHLGQYEHVLLVSTDVASRGINYNHLESCALFGDGAAAVVLGKDPAGSSKILCSHMATYSSGAHYTEIRGGGNRLPAYTYTQENEADYVFHMDGKQVFKFASCKIESFIANALKPTGKSFEENLQDIAVVIPHQASPSSLGLIQRRLGIPDEKYVNIVATHGNMVGASVPYALHEAVRTGRLNRGEKALLFGAGAGLSFGAVLLEY